MPDIQQSDCGTFKVFTLSNSNGIRVAISDLGGIIRSICVPDKDGKVSDIALGFSKMDQYFRLPDRAYFGAIIGRYANRIGKGQFKLGQQTHQLATNNGEHHLHGGTLGFDQATWQAESGSNNNGVQLQLRHDSPDGEEGFPGNLKTTVTYRLNEENELLVQFAANTDQPTHVNFTQHTYFNLKGEGSGDVLDHHLRIAADHYTPVDATAIPTGQLASVTDTPFDFRGGKLIAADIDANHEQLLIGKGYDHNWVINGHPGELRFAAEVYEASTGRSLEVLTTEPGMQLYTGNFLDERFKGKSGVAYGPRSGLCLETQHFPDSPNQPHFPSTLLQPGQLFESTTVFRFSTRA